MSLAVLDAQHHFGEVGLEERLHCRGQQHHAEEAVHHRGDARQQFHGGLQHPVDGGAGEPGHVDGGEQPDGHPHHQRTGGDVAGAKNHGQDAVDVIAGFPALAQQELQRADLADGRQAVGEQEQADERHRQNGHAGAGGEQQPHDGFFQIGGMIHKAPIPLYTPQGRPLCALAVLLSIGYATSLHSVTSPT